jgi:hypothetical protein
VVPKRAAREARHVALASPESGPALPTPRRGHALRQGDADQAAATGARRAAARRQAAPAAAQYRAGRLLPASAQAAETVPRAAGAARRDLLVRRPQRLDGAAEAPLPGLRARARNLSRGLQGRLEGGMPSAPSRGARRPQAGGPAPRILRLPPRAWRHQAAGTPRPPTQVRRRGAAARIPILPPPLERRRAPHHRSPRGRSGTRPRPDAQPPPAVPAAPRAQDGQTRSRRCVPIGRIRRTDVPRP